MNTDSFQLRHIGPNQKEQEKMLATIKADNFDQLIHQTIPDDIRLKDDLDLPPAMSEYEYLQHIHELGSKNKVFKSYIGLGYHEAIVPSVIQRNILENPGWYTAYTPYQAEIAQGRLEALLNYQTMVCDLTGMELANASLLDEGTAAAEAMALLFDVRERSQKKAGADKFFISEEILPQTLSVLQTRATPIGIELVIGNHTTFDFSENFFGAILQYPAKHGQVYDYTDFVAKANERNIKVAVAADILSLVKLKSPAEFGVDVVVGTTQRFGIPLGYGGPHAGYFATKEKYKRSIPGRIIGVTKDVDGGRALRMALQTREQHIKREKATSNICTAQVLLAVMAGMYAVYHGKNGLQYIANQVHSATQTLAKGLTDVGFEQTNTAYFDTITIKVETAILRPVAEANGINFNYIDANHISISVNETVSLKEINAIIDCFKEAFAIKSSTITEFISTEVLPKDVQRNTSFLDNEIFNTYQSETDMMRYIKKLERKDLALNHSMISLGSCTMKLNAASEMLPLSNPNWGNIHPFVPLNQAEGYQLVLKNLEHQLNIITGFAATSLQPNSGAQGEFAGLMTIRAYHEANGETHRNICLIPASAHGTNPASAVMAGMKVVVTKTDEKGNIDIEDLREKAIEHSENLAALMVTYPSTHGVFESAIQEITQIIHDHGGQVYMDGANMNAQVGLTNPATIGADVCHLNLHKTFSIPHGGGGPGVGPIGVKEHLRDFLPNHTVSKISGTNEANGAVSAAPFGSAGVLPITWMYLAMLGKEGVTESTKMALLNANYLTTKLSEHYSILYRGRNDKVGHECIVDLRPIKAETGITEVDFAKRLMDYGFHAPTMSFPVAGTFMMEPTESEPLNEINRFSEAMISIKKETEKVKKGEWLEGNNPLCNSPHTQTDLLNWDKPYSIKDAIYPVKGQENSKFWPSVNRIDDVYGDRNLMCSCPSPDDYR